MIRYIVDSIADMLRARVFWLGIIFFGLFSIIAVRLFDLQIVNEDYYMDTYISKSEKELSTSPTRGRIYDRNGNLLAYNEMTYSITMEDTLESTDDKDAKLNEIIYNAIHIIEKNGDSMVNDFILAVDKKGDFYYNESYDGERLRFLKDIYGTEELDTEEAALSATTAGEAYEYLLTEEKYNIAPSYCVEDTLKIMRVRYKLSSNAYQKYIATTIADNVSEKTVIAIYENESILSGVEVKESTKRIYNYSQYFAHIIGYTGSISDAQLEEFTSAGLDYETEDVVGKSGIESYMETELQGTKGKKSVFVDSTGRILSTLSETEPKAGNDVYLTIDLNLQIAGYHILEQELAGVLAENIVNRDKTDKDETTVIPIKDVYFQLINNNIIDMEHFNAADASDNEKWVYEKFLDRREDVLAGVLSDLTEEDPVWMESLSEEYQSYYDYIYDELTGEWNIIDISSIDSEDEYRTAWMKNKISLKEILEYYIGLNLVDLEKLKLGETYVTSEEVYQSILTYTMDRISEDKDFGKLIYKQLIQSGSIIGSELCMILYDQGVFTDKDTWYSTLSAGDSYQTFNFIIDKIKKIELTPQMLALDPCSGSVIVTDVNTGDVLACVTYPSYDNNMFSGYVDEDYWNKLLEDKSTPLYNRATQSRTAPGSTFKVLTAIAALEEKIINPYTSIHDTGEFDLIKPTVRCWIYPGAHGSLNVMDALMVSCNYFFCQMGYDFSIDSDGDFNEAQGLATLRKYGGMFGLTEKTGIELEENEPLFSTNNPVTSSIGQGSHSFTNIQLSRYITTVASRGTRYNLTVLDKITDSEGNLVKNLHANVEEKLSVSDTTWDTVWTGMHQMAQDSSILRQLDIELCGKTGTAQENLSRPDHGVFVSFAPYPNPKIAITAVVPNGGSSSRAMEVAKNMYDFYYGDKTAEDIINENASSISGEIIND